ncbi:hypothetical protein [Stieleria mannarensis]|uniref:hypothetical protein n=1 Tax=Stieleria mannarensis TaxID=2755585 RepID=UPI001601E833|nr:hypothetical protein [Rhodopirellula sp. JC639]
MRLLIITALLLATAVVVPAVRSFSEESEPLEREMQRKLEYSKQILDGLVTEDFEKIRQGARSLNEFGKRKWIENESAAYRTQNQVFWFTTGTLLMAADNKNIDGATLSYTQMTHSCVNCHKLLRRQ